MKFHVQLYFYCHISLLVNFTFLQYTHKRKWQYFSCNRFLHSERTHNNNTSNTSTCFFFGRAFGKIIICIFNFEILWSKNCFRLNDNKEEKNAEKGDKHEIHTHRDNIIKRIILYSLFEGKKMIKWLHNAMQYCIY